MGSSASTNLYSDVATASTEQTGAACSASSSSLLARTSSSSTDASVVMMLSASWGSSLSEEEDEALDNTLIPPLPTFARLPLENTTAASSQPPFCTSSRRLAATVSFNNDAYILLGDATPPHPALPATGLIPTSLALPHSSLLDSATSETVMDELGDADVKKRDQNDVTNVLLRRLNASNRQKHDSVVAGHQLTHVAVVRTEFSPACLSPSNSATRIVPLLREGVPYHLQRSRRTSKMD